MIVDGSEGIKILTSMIGKILIKLVWIFPELDIFNKFKPVSTYLLTGSTWKTSLVQRMYYKEAILEIILSVFSKYIFYK